MTVLADQSVIHPSIRPHKAKHRWREEDVGCWTVLVLSIATQKIDSISDAMMAVKRQPCTTSEFSARITLPPSTPSTPPPTGALVGVVPAPFKIGSDDAGLGVAVLSFSARSSDFSLSVSVSVSMGSWTSMIAELAALAFSVSDMVDDGRRLRYIEARLVSCSFPLRIRRETLLPFSIQVVLFKASWLASSHGFATFDVIMKSTQKSPREKIAVIQNVADKAKRISYAHRMHPLGAEGGRTYQMAARCRQ